MSLAAKLIKTPEREKAGSETALRYEFQTLWGLTLLFQHHATGAEYAIVFEFHDDVALFDNPSEPISVRFYQIKSKGTVGGWTLDALLRRAKSAKKDTPPKPSIVDKMFDNVRKFHPDVESVEFVSNEACGLKVTSTQFKFNECEPEHFKKIVDSVRQFDSLATEAEVALLGFRRTNLSLGDPTTHVKGKLHDFVVENLGDVSFNLDSLFKAIVDECRRKSTRCGPFLDIVQLVREKGITRAQVQVWLDAVEAERRAPPWSDIAIGLEEVPYLEQVEIRREYELYRSAVLNVGDSATHRVRKAIRIALHDFSALPATAHRLVDVIEFVSSQCQPTASKYMAAFSLSQLKAMIIYEIHAAN